MDIWIFLVNPLLETNLVNLFNYFSLFNYFVSILFYRKTHWILLIETNLVNHVYLFLCLYSYWILLNLIESYWILLNLIVSYWILLNLIESYWILLNLIEYLSLWLFSWNRMIHFIIFKIYLNNTYILL